MKSNNLIIETESLIKVLSGVEVINKCNMTVYEGSIYGLLGANGAGKTTLFKLLTGLLTPTAGKAKVFGMDISTCSNQILQSIGSLIEVPVFYDHLSATENLEIHLSYMNIKNADITAVLEMVGLQGVNHQPVSKYSLGMRQRLAIARAIVHKPKLLILDEPINGLDPIGIREMRELFLKLVKNHGMTILISSHILSEIEHLADTIGVMSNGVLVEEVPMKAVKDQFPSGLEDYFFNIMSGGRKYA
jgi:ABC-2 type transport system ATP-binding protein